MSVVDLISSIDRRELLEILGERRPVASISGGKDSAALALLLRELEIDHDRVFLDTGWESNKTYDYLRGPLTDALGPITEVRGPRQMVSLVLKKGMFSSRQRRFCTQELKVFPMRAYFEQRIEYECLDFVNAVGIRRAESKARERMAEWEESPDFPVEIWRPLIHWTEQDVIDMHTRHGLVPNPLYLEGASRVGCWPCVFARKSEIRHIADTDPERIDLIRRLEDRVAKRASARYAAKGETFESLGYVEPSWFQSPMPVRTWETCPRCLELAEQGADDVCDHCNGTGKVLKRTGEPWPIDRVVEWSRTSRGGRQMELFAAPEREQGCMRWGLCETVPESDDDEA